MYLHGKLHKAKCLKLTDYGARAEFYWTWQMTSEMDGDCIIAQGHSQGCPIDDGYEFATGQERRLGDPHFTVKLPDLKEGAENRIRLDLYCWEADGVNTAEIKKLFTNAAAERLWAIYEAEQRRKKEAVGAFTSWLETSGTEVLTGTTSTVPGVSDWLKIPSVVVSLLPVVIKAIEASNNDEIIGVMTAEILYRRQNGAISYSWIFDGGVELMIDQQTAPVYRDQLFHEANNENIVDTRILFQTIFGIGDIPTA